MTAPASTSTMTALAVTIGTGKKNPYGERRALDASMPVPSALAALLNDLSAGVHEQWWSPHRWTNDHRKKDAWLGSFGVPVDVDYHDGKGDHTERVPDDKAEALGELARSRVLPGQLFHATPGGARVVFVFADETTDAKEWERAEQGARELVREAIARAGLAAVRNGKLEVAGFVVDSSAKDRARMNWAPRCVDDKGRGRDAVVFVMREGCSTPTELAAHAPDMRKESDRARRELRIACAKVREAPRGEANGVLNRSAFFIGQLVGYGALSEDVVKQELLEGAKQNGYQDGEDAAAAVIASALEAGKKEPRPPSARRIPTQGGRPSICVNEELHILVERAERVLAENPASRVWVRGTELVHVAHAASAPRATVKRPPGAPTVLPLVVESLREKLSRSAAWFTVGREGAEAEVHPPKDVAGSLLRKGEYALIPPLVGVVTAPTLRADGSVIETPGFDELTGVLYEPQADFPPLPEVTPENAKELAAKAAAELMTSAYSEFPFADPEGHPLTSAAATLAFILTIVGRHAIPGPTPLFASLTSTPGVGKGLLLRAGAIIGTGREPTLLAVPTRDEEMGKVLVTLHREGDAVALFDNAVGAFGSASLSAALTADEFSGRLLGLNAKAGGRWRCVLCVTGNNIVFRADTPRRVIPIMLETDLEDPERRSFRIPDLPGYCKAHFAELHVHALTILRAFHVAGRPHHGKPDPTGSYESWDALIRGAVIFSGIGDPCAGREEVRKESDSDLDTLRTLVGIWHDQFGCDEVTVAELMAKAGLSDPLRNALLDAQPHGGKRDPDKLDSNSIGYYLRRMKRRPVRLLDDEGKPAGLHRIAKGKQRRNVATWRIVEVRRA